MAAWQFYLLVTSSIRHLTNRTPIFQAFRSRQSIEYEKKELYNQAEWRISDKKKQSEESLHNSKEWRGTI